MKPVMYIFLNRDLGMSTGKASAQVVDHEYRTPLDRIMMIRSGEFW